MSFDILTFLQQKTDIKRITEKEIFLLNCPQCGPPSAHDSTISVSRQKNLFYCFRCGYKGNWVKIVAKLARISYEEARQRVEGDIDLAVAPKEEKPKYELYLPPNTGWTLGSENYLLNRGLSKETIRYFGLYYCNRGFYAKRIIIPAKVKGEIVTFQARAIDSKAEPRYRSPKNAPKSEIWFNLDAYRPGMRVLIVEGPFDVLRLYELGIFAICPFGKSISEPAKNILTNMQIHDIYLLQDRDAAPFLNKSWRQLSAYFQVKLMSLTEANDPGEISEQESKTLFDVSYGTVAAFDHDRVRAWRDRRLC